MGNSQGVLIPKPILAQLGLAGTVDLQVRDGVIEIRPSRANPREGWAEDARAYNEIVTGWSGVERAAGTGGEEQRELFDG